MAADDLEAEPRGLETDLTPEQKTKRAANFGCVGLAIAMTLMIGLTPIIRSCSDRRSDPRQTISVRSETGPRTGAVSVSDLQYKTAAKAVVRRHLRDPDSADFGSLQVIRAAGRAVTVCGTVNSRNGLGGMSGFQRFIASDTLVLEEQLPAGQMNEVWARYC